MRIQLTKSIKYFDVIDNTKDVIKLLKAVRTFYKMTIIN